MTRSPQASKQPPCCAKPDPETACSQTRQALPTLLLLLLRRISCRASSLLPFTCTRVLLLLQGVVVFIACQPGTDTGHRISSKAAVA